MLSVGCKVESVHFGVERWLASQAKAVEGRDIITSVRGTGDVFVLHDAAALTRPPSCGRSAMKSDVDADPGQRPGQFVRTVCGGPGYGYG